MGIFGWLGGLFGNSTNPMGSINPANGLPMIGAVDIKGNPYGTDSSHESHASTFGDDTGPAIEFNDAPHVDESINTFSDDAFASQVFEINTTSCFDDDWSTTSCNDSWSSSCFDD